MSSKTPHKLSTILGMYFITQIILFGIALLFWAYYTNMNSINREIENSFVQRQAIADEILAREADRIDTALYEIKINKELLTELSEVQADRGLDVFLNYTDKIARHKLDVLLILTNDDSVWLDASSPFPNVTPILEQLSKLGRSYLSEARIERIKSLDVDFTGIFKSRKIVLESGEVLGIVIGGTILNANYSLLHNISLKSKTPTVIFAEDEKIIAAFSTFESNQQNKILNHTLYDCKDDDIDYHRMTNYNLIFKKYVVEFAGNSSNISIFLGLSDDILTNLQSSYLYILLSVLTITAFFLFSTLIITRRLIYPSVRRVLEYTEKISKDVKDVMLSPGSIIELNTIGSALVTMVDSINISKKELKKSEKKFRSYVENAPNGIFVANKQGEYIEVNKAAEQITGFSRDKLLSMNFADLISEDDKETASDHFNRLVISGKASGDMKFIRKDLSRGYWSVDAIKITDTLFLGFVTDISFRKNAEEKIKSSLREKEILLQEVHHRVKNNLQFIISLLDIEMQHHGSSSGIYNDTISRIRQFSIIYSKLYLQDDMANINFAVTVKESVDEILSIHSVNNEKITFNFDIPQPVFPIDKALPLSLIINELVTNSIKYAFEGAGVIDLVLHHSMDGDITKFVYSDNGKGMKSAHSGFGTKLVNILADQLDLKIDISSDKGVLYKFSSREKKTVIAPMNSKILYVEDQILIALSRIKALEKMGFNIYKDVIVTGEKTLEFLQETEILPSMILMDIGLSGKLNGIETARELRKDYDIPILFCTGYEDKAIKDEIALITNTEYIGKTCTNKEFKVAIETMLKIDNHGTEAI